LQIDGLLMIAGAMVKVLWRKATTSRGRCHQAGV